MIRYCVLVFTVFLAINSFGQVNLSAEDEALQEKKSRELALSAISYFKKNDLKKSTELLFEAKKEAEKTNNYALIAEIYGSISHQYIQLNLKEKAKEYLLKAITQINQLPNGPTKSRLKGLSFIDLGNLAFDEKRYNEANALYKKAYRQFELIKSSEKNIYHYRRSLYNIGRSYFFMKKSDSAEWYLNRSLMVEDANNDQLKLFINNTLSQIYSEKGLYKKAITLLEGILKDPQLKDERLRLDVYYNLAQLHKKNGDYRAYSVYNEQFIKETNLSKEKELKAINSAINAEQKNLESVISQSDWYKQLLIGGLVVIIVIFITVILILNLKRKKEKRAFEIILEGLQTKSITQIKEDYVKIKEEAETQPNPVENEILAKLAKFEANKKFLNSKLNISNLAVQLKTNTSYLSDVINTYKGKNYNTYINDLRINYICDKIYNNKEYQKYKISYLAEECGFTSHSAFATVFKNTTGISPSIFLREASKRSVNL